MAELRPAYLVAGDDDAKIDAWRTRVRRRAEEERGPGGLETFEAAETSPEEVAGALAALTFDPGTRYLLVEGAGAWKASRLGPLEAALKTMPPDTVLVLVVRGKPLKQLVKAVEAAGGEVRDCAAPKPWELPGWVVERAREEGLQMDIDAARELVSVVGTRQATLAREIERLALAVRPAAHLSAEEVPRLAAGDAAPGAYDLADALVAGDRQAALRLAQDLSAHGERPSRLLFPVVRRLREVHGAAVLLDRGMPEQKVAQAMKAPPWLAKRTVARAKKSDRAALERGICVLADLEVELRGGGPRGGTGLDEDTAFSLALASAAG